MRISEAAERSGLSVDTIRYYEKAGLLPDVERGADGHRVFSVQLIDWLQLLASLRATGMPLRTMAEFADAYRVGDSALDTRRDILLQHADQLRATRAKIEACEALLAHKLTRYEARKAELRGTEVTKKHV